MSKQQSGLSLIEMLVGMTLLFITLALLFTASYQIRQQQTAGEILAQGSDDYRLVMRFITKLIEQAGPITVLNGKDNHVLFNGQTQQLEFVSFLPSHAGGAGLYRVQLVTKENQLLLYYQPLAEIGRQQPTAAQNQVSLLSDIDGLQLDYFSRQHGWQSIWHQQPLLPEKVRIRFHHQHAHYWPPLTIAVAAEAVPPRPHLSVGAQRL